MRIAANGLKYYLGCLPFWVFCRPRPEVDSFADKSAKTGRFGLQLSGHSHGGQIVLPFIGAPALPRLGQKYPSGLYKVGDMWQYTNRGVGMVLPIRINCRAEVTVFTLNPA